MSSELAYYDQAALWGNEPLEYQRAVRRDLMALIPKDVTSILDAGCGDGAITNALPERLRVVGLDFSAAAIEHVRWEKVIADIAEMPFEDGAFDLVMANDVLEHLPEDGFEAALAEIARVARRYILITVPILENLAAQTSRCGECGRFFHINHHYRAFGVGEVLDLFAPRASAETALFTGAAVRPGDEAARRLRSALGIMSKWELAVCPSCGAGACESAATIDEIRTAARLAKLPPGKALEERLPDKNEIAVLFDKEAAPDGTRGGSEGEFRLLAVFEDETRSVPSKAVSNEGELSLRAGKGALDGASRVYVELAAAGAALRVAVEPSQDSVTVPPWLDVERLLALRPPEVKPRQKDSVLLESIKALLTERDALDKEAADWKQKAGRAESHARESSAEDIRALRMREAEALARLVEVSAALRKAERSLEDSNESARMLKGRLAGTDRALEESRQKNYLLQARLAQAEKAASAAKSQTSQLQERLAAAERSAEYLSMRMERHASQSKARLDSANEEFADLKSAVGRLEEAVAAGRAREKSLENDLLAARLPLHKKAWRAFKSSIKPLGKGEWTNRKTCRETLLAQARPEAFYSDWSRIAAGRRFVMICHDQAIDRRIIQQAEALISKGHHGIVIALSFDGSDAIDDCDGIPVHRVGLNRVIPDCPVYWRYQNRQRWILWWGRAFRLLSAANWKLYRTELALVYRNRTLSHPLPFDNAFEAAASLYPAEMVVAHDLPALAAAKSAADRWGATLVYDSHELYSDQAVFSRRQRRLLDERERSCAPHCALVTTVSDSLADRIGAKNDIPRPEVILNVTRGKPGSLRRQRLFHETLGLDAAAKVMLFQGGMLRNRNIETLVRGFALAGENNLHLVFLGPREADAESRVRKAAGELLGKQIHLIDEVGQDVLLDYTSSADFGVIPYVACDLNTRYCMPNKLFEYIQAGLPILANRLVEIEKTLSNIGGGGMAADLSSPESTAKAIRAMLLRDLEADRAALAEVKAAYSWESERERYLSLIEKALSGKEPHVG
jgi:glycosyltransferase involved in cell wall biosynthesis/SAM-dependent methyltransferase